MPDTIVDPPVQSPPPVESPPPAPQPARPVEDSRARLHALATQLVRTQNRRLMLEYLRLRRSSL